MGNEIDRDDCWDTLTCTLLNFHTLTMYTVARKLNLFRKLPVDYLGIPLRY